MFRLSTNRRLIAGAIGVIVVIAAALQFGVRHGVDGWNEHLRVGSAIWVFDADSPDLVSIGIRPCAEGEPIEITGISGMLLAGEAEIVGVVTRTFDFTEPGMGSSEGFPPVDEEFSDVVWEPMSQPYEITKRCDSGTAGFQEIVVGVRFGDGGGALRPAIEFNAGLIRYTISVDGQEVAKCGPAIDEVERYADLCLGG